MILALAHSINEIILILISKQIMNEGKTESFISRSNCPLLRIQCSKIKRIQFCRLILTATRMRTGTNGFGLAMASSSGSELNHYLRCHA